MAVVLLTIRLVGWMFLVEVFKLSLSLVSVIWSEISPHRAPLIGVVSEGSEISNLHPSLTHLLTLALALRPLVFTL